MKTLSLLGAFLLTTVVAFQPTGVRLTRVSSLSVLTARRRTLVQEDKSFDPFHLSDETFPSKHGSLQPYEREGSNDFSLQSGLAATGGAVVALTSLADSAMAQTDVLSQGKLDPSTFQPVCPASDGFYRFLQSSTEAVVGPESFLEYGPLIAGGLLRVRLELCVVESFFEEAIVPFIARNGLNWVLPLHETVETFLAGTIFALALTFILIGSTKLVNVVIFFTDLFFGSPARLFGGFFYDRAQGKPVTLDLGLGPFKTRVIGPPEEEIADLTADPLGKGAGTVAVLVLSGIIKYAGEFLRVSCKCKFCCRDGFCIALTTHRLVFSSCGKIVRQIFEAIDLFVGRYLVIWSSGYILFKFAHYKIFPDFP